MQQASATEIRKQGNKSRLAWEYNTLFARLKMRTISKELDSFHLIWNQALLGRHLRGLGKSVETLPTTDWTLNEKGSRASSISAITREMG
jgi:hypothetical protein